jgi:hypothetical protein
MKRITAARQHARMMEADPTFISVTRAQHLGGLAPYCGLLLADGRYIEAQVIGRDRLGNFSVFTTTGYMLQYLNDEVA